MHTLNALYDVTQCTECKLHKYGFAYIHYGKYCISYA